MGPTEALKKEQLPFRDHLLVRSAPSASRVRIARCITIFWIRLMLFSSLNVKQQSTVEVALNRNERQRRARYGAVQSWVQ